VGGPGFQAFSRGSLTGRNPTIDSPFYHLPSWLAVVPLGGVVGVVEPTGMVGPGGVVVTAPPPPPPPQLAAHTVIRKIAVIRANVAVNIEIPFYTALLESLSHTRRLLATTATLPNHLLSNQCWDLSAGRSYYRGQQDVRNAVPSARPFKVSGRRSFIR
jgi:hypothetical protein